MRLQCDVLRTFPTLLIYRPSSVHANRTVYTRPPRAGSGPPARSDRLAACTLNRTYRLSVAEGLGLGVRGLICAIDRWGYYRERPKHVQQSPAPGPRTLHRLHLLPFAGTARRHVARPSIVFKDQYQKFWRRERDCGAWYFEEESDDIVLSYMFSKTQKWRLCWGCVCRCNCLWVNEWMNEWVGEWVNEWISEWISEWMSEWVLSRYSLTVTMKTN